MMEHKETPLHKRFLLDPNWVLPLRRGIKNGSVSWEDFGKAFFALFDLSMDGTEIDFDKISNAGVAMLLEAIAPKVKSNREKYNEIVERNRNNGKKGGAPRKNKRPDDGEDAAPRGGGADPQPMDAAPRDGEASADDGEDAAPRGGVGAAGTHHPQPTKEAKQRPVSDVAEEICTEEFIMKMFPFVEKSFAAPFVALIKHFKKKDPKLLPITPDACSALYSKLIKFSGRDLNKARAVANYTIENDYADIFEYKPKMAKYAAVAPGGADRRRGMDAKPHTLEEYEEDYFAGDPKPIGAAMRGVVGKML